MFLITKMEGAGAQKVMLETARHFQQSPAHRVIAVCLYDQDYIGEAYQLYGVHVLDLGMKDARARRPLWTNALRGLRGCMRLYRLLRAERVDLLQTYDFYANAIGVVIGRLVRVPVVVMSQRVVYVKRWRFWVDRLVSHWAHAVTAVSESVRDFCVRAEGMRPDRITVIRNGVDLSVADGEFDHVGVRRAHRLPIDAPLIGAIGRLSEQKGQAVLIRAVEVVRRQIPNVHVVIVGQGPDRERLLTLVAELGLSESIHFTGHVSHVQPLLAAMDIFAHPSLWEGMPNAVLEAMALAKPIIATRVDGSAELIVDGESGLLIPPNDVEALAQAMLLLLTDAQLARRLAWEAYIRATDEFSRSNMLATTEHLYGSLLARAGRSLHAIKL
ncbi:MAG TPA: glycosyltransferase [Anaerolineae bacterium]|nr:glycosyltransferase [Anaerolineae bacterium]